ncbi:DUF5689 domain-containing protein [Lutimonas saemankumensis]|uniref:DUF5689 domain-containing protein n=1 Tax=Lutimonas saemankumensis TaxID=483016 RepID=UPI001CD5429D|nr:DUF5689 domain-containing protein [Lutimonas saemankumensis]MCA0933037.1 DUF5689 domain-containing protein [Lutimonas saemankumensis]
MKISLTLILAVICIVLLAQCYPEKQNISFDEEIPSRHLGENIDMKTILTNFNQEESEILSFDADYSVTGFVVSSDESGNFYKTLILQDKAVSPEVALEVKIDLRAYFSRYNLGRKIHLNLKGLSMNKIKGKFIVGYLSGNRVKEIPESLIKRHLIRTDETMELQPESIRFEDVTIERTNTYVFLEDIQISKEDLGKSFASEVYDQYNGERIIQQCNNGVSGKLVTSEYADFSGYATPAGTFSMKAVLTIDSYSGEFVYILNNPDDLSETNKGRCDIEAFKCPLNEVSENDIIFFADFNQLKSSKDIELQGWKNTNVNFLSNRFKKRSSNENTYVQISSYNSLEPVSEVWLVSPKIDLDNSSKEFLFFDSRATFEEGTLLSVWYTEKLEENLKYSDWKLLNAKISEGSLDGSNKIFTGSGKILLNCIEGSIHLGFRYIGYDPGASTTYDIDNIRILGKRNI